MIYTLEQVVAAGKKKYPWAEYSDEAWDEWGAAELEKRAQKKAAKEAAAALPEVVEFGPAAATSWERVCAEPSLDGPGTIDEHQVSSDCYIGPSVGLCYLA